MFLPFSHFVFLVNVYAVFIRTAKAKVDFEKALQRLQDSLSDTIKKEGCEDICLMGTELTLADIVIVSTLIYPFQMVYDRDYLVGQSSFDMVVRWFEQCVQRPEFVAVLGTVEIGSKVPPTSSTEQQEAVSKTE